jgi:transcriptional regulator with XRE-family HTH domain
LPVTEPRPTFKRRQLARLLRRLREQARLSIEEAAPRLHFSTAKLSRIERAVNGVDVHAVKSMLDLYDLPGDQWPEIIDMAVRARERGWWHAYGLDDLGYVALEAEACTVREYQLTFVPGLLQTEDYARLTFTASRTRRSEQQLRKEIAVRMRRQQRLVEAPPLAFETVIDETALRWPVGDTVVMRAQLRRLAELADLSNVTVRVLPHGHGLHDGVNGAFWILGFPEPQDPDITYAEGVFGSVQVEKPAKVHACKVVFDHLRSLALDPPESRAFIERVAAEL